jgi:hypothetical protein
VAVNKAGGESQFLKALQSGEITKIRSKNLLGANSIFCGTSRVNHVFFVFLPCSGELTTENSYTFHFIYEVAKKHDIYFVHGKWEMLKG